MKAMRRILFVFALAISATCVSYAANNTAEETQVRDVKNFNAVDVSTGIQLYITMGNTESLKIEASEKIINNVRSEVRNGTLHIYVKKTGILFPSFRSNSSIKAYLSVKELNRLQASAGAQVKSENTIKGNALDLGASSGSHVNMDLAYQELNINSSSGAQMKVKGITKNLKAATSSGGSVNAADLQSEYGRINASSGGHITVNTTTEITASASSGGSIRYSGNPRNKNINKSSGGSVSSR